MLFMFEWLMKIGAPKLWWDIEDILHNFYNICSLWKIQLILKSRTKMPVKPVPKDSHIHILGDVILVTFFLLLCKKCTLAVKCGGWSIDSREREGHTLLAWSPLLEPQPPVSLLQFCGPEALWNLALYKNYFQFL